MGRGVGENTGEAVGLPGIAVGAGVGFGVGRGVGWPEGAGIGTAVGIADGFEVGTGDGASLGGVVGTAVVGSADGAGLGGVVGTGLGTEVGTGVEMKKATSASATSSSVALTCVEINQCVRCTRQFFTKSFLSDGVAALVPSSGEESASPRHRAGVASMAWRTTR